MSYLSIFFIAISLAMDAFGVSVSNCMILKKVSVKTALKFGLFFGVFQFLMPVVGYFCAAFFSDYLKVLGNWLSFGLLLAIGANMIISALRQEENVCCDTTEAQILSFKNLTMLAVATSIDALAVGVTFALTDIHIFTAAAIIGVVAFVLSSLGAFFGSRLAFLSAKNAEIFGGVVLIAIGIKILLGF